jgi:hypothetical protein
MRDYRLYLMDRITGHFKGRSDFSSDDDTSAILVADSCENDDPKELWRGVHKLKHWEAAPLSQSADTINVTPSAGP